MPHHAVARSGPVERRGRRYAAVNPVVGVFDGDFLPFVGKAPVLHAAAVEVFICPCAEGQFCLGFGDCSRRGFFHYGRAFSGFIYAHQSCVLVKREQHLGRADGHGRGLLADCEGCAEIVARRLHEYVGGRLCLRIAHVASRIVAEEAEDVVAIKVHEQRMPVGVGDFNGSGIYQFGFGNGICGRACGLHGIRRISCGIRRISCGSRAQRTARTRQQSDCQGHASPFGGQGNVFHRMWDI